MRRKQEHGEQKLIGTWQLDSSYYDVFVLPEDVGGWFYCLPEDPEDRALPRIKVGIAGGWHAALSALLHEALEAALCQRHLRLADFDRVDSSTNIDGLVFVLTHDDFSNVVRIAAQFLAEAMPALSRAYNDQQRRARLAKRSARRRRK